MPVISSANLGRQMGRVLTALAPLLEVQEVSVMAGALNRIPQRGVARVGALRDWLYLLNGTSVFTLQGMTRRPSNLIAQELGLPTERGTFLTASSVRDIASTLILAGARNHNKA